MSLSDHEQEIATLYFGEGKSYQDIADQFGVSREAVRQFLNRHFPDRVGGRTFRKELRSAEKKATEEALLEARKAGAPECAVCYDPVTRKTGGRGENRTCSAHHSELWSKARFLLNEELRERQRLSMANSILRYHESHLPSAVAWAQKVVNGEPINTRTYVRKESQARQAYEEVMQIRAERGRE